VRLFVAFAITLSTFVLVIAFSELIITLRAMQG
jgi:hypothetical protein